MKELTRTSIVAIPFLVMAAIVYLITNNPFVYDKHGDDEEFRQFIAVTTQWQTVTFDKPLKINRAELQCLRIGMTYDKYESAVGYIARRDWEAGVPDSSHAVEEHIIRISDQKLIRPELELVANDGKIVRLKNTGILGGTADVFQMEYTAYRASRFDSVPPFPETSDHFKAMRIKANEPFEIVSIAWAALGY